MYLCYIFVLRSLGCLGLRPLIQETTGQPMISLESRPSWVVIGSLIKISVPSLNEGLVDLGTKKGGFT